MMRPSVGGVRRSSAGGRRSSAGGRPSLAPMRIKQDNASNVGRGGRSSVGGSAVYGSGAGSSTRKRAIPRFRGGAPAPGSSRRSSASSVRGNFGHEVIKDIRPIKDKSYMQREINDILAFLHQYDYPHPVTKKNLISPTTKDFLRIFEFIYSFITPNYKMPAKHEEEIPLVLKNLRYPFVLSKTAMFSLSSPHTWPHILAAVHWMIEVVKYALKVDANQLLFSPDVNSDDGEQFQQPESQLFFGFVEATYEDYLSGCDSFEDKEQEMADKLRRKTLGMASDPAQLEMEERRLADELAQLEAEPNRLVSAMERLQTIRTDNNKLGKFMKELDNHRNGQLQKFQDVELQVQQKDMELRQLDEAKGHLEHQLANQELSSADVQRIQTEARMLNSAIDQVERENQRLDKEIWDEERKIAKLQEQLEKKVAEYNSTARRLKLIPADAENARGINFEMRLTFGNPASLEAFNTTIKPALQRLKTEASEKVHEINNLKLLEEERLDELTETVENKVSQVSKLEATVHKLEEEITNFKEKSTKECDMFGEKARTLESQLKAYISQGDGNIDQAEANLIAKRDSNERRFQEMAKEKKDYEQFLLNACSQVVEHKIKIQEHLQGLAQKGRNYLDAIRAMKVPTVDLDEFKKQ